MGYSFSPTVEVGEGNEDAHCGVWAADGAPDGAFCVMVASETGEAAGVYLTRPEAVKLRDALDDVIGLAPVVGLDGGIDEPVGYALAGSVEGDTDDVTAAFVALAFVDKRIEAYQAISERLAVFNPERVTLDELRAELDHLVGA